MDSAEYREGLMAQISADEWMRLAANDPSLVISEHNRTTLLEMRDQDAITKGEVDERLASELACDLQRFLDDCMADQPQGHKWIVIASLYLTFVAHRPMHALDRVGIIVEQRGDATLYYCPNKVPGDNLTCDCCVCLPMPSDKRAAFGTRRC